MPFDLSVFLQTVEHAKGTETSGLMAYKLDDADGIAEAIGFKTHVINKVDYFLELGLQLHLIECSDLQDDIARCHSHIGQALEKLRQDTSISEKWKREQLKVIKKEVWQTLRDEFGKKWSGSIAVIERLYRRTNRPSDIDPSYSLLIVCKNDTDVRMLDALINQLNGQCHMGRSVIVCNTQHLPNFILS